jgi:hypothetical protein
VGCFFASVLRLRLLVLSLSLLPLIFRPLLPVLPTLRRLLVLPTLRRLLVLLTLRRLPVLPTLLLLPVLPTLELLPLLLPADNFPLLFPLPAVGLTLLRGSFTSRLLLVNPTSVFLLLPLFFFAYTAVADSTNFSAVTGASSISRDLEAFLDIRLSFTPTPDRTSIHSGLPFFEASFTGVTLIPLAGTDRLVLSLFDRSNDVR